MTQQVTQKVSSLESVAKANHIVKVVNDLIDDFYKGQDVFIKMGAYMLMAKENNLNQIAEFIENFLKEKYPVNYNNFLNK